MIRDRAILYRRRVHRTFREVFEEKYIPQEVAASFAIGVFVTAMPTGGLGIALFFVLASIWSWASKTAMLAAVVVLNPLVKPVIYASSIKLGALLLGPDPVVFFEITALDYTATALQFLLVGNLVIASVLAAMSYVIVLEWMRSCHGRDTMVSHVR